MGFLLFFEIDCELVDLCLL